MANHLASLPAGRVRPGHCFRLCTEEDYQEKLPLATGDHSAALPFSPSCGTVCLCGVPLVMLPVLRLRRVRGACIGQALAAARAKGLLWVGGEGSRWSDVRGARGRCNAPLRPPPCCCSARDAAQRPGQRGAPAEEPGNRQHHELRLAGAAAVGGTRLRAVKQRCGVATARQRSAVSRGG